MHHIVKHRHLHFLMLVMHQQNKKNAYIGTHGYLIFIIVSLDLSVLLNIDAVISPAIMEVRKA